VPKLLHCVWRQIWTAVRYSTPSQHSKRDAAAEKEFVIQLLGMIWAEKLQQGNAAWIIVLDFHFFSPQKPPKAEIIVIFSLVSLPCGNMWFVYLKRSAVSRQNIWTNIEKLYYDSTIQPDSGRNRQPVYGRNRLPTYGWNRLPTYGRNRLPTYGRNRLRNYVHGGIDWRVMAVINCRPMAGIVCLPMAGIYYRPMAGRDCRPYSMFILPTYGRTSWPMPGSDSRHMAEQD
jgi:hypothetical protein